MVERSDTLKSQDGTHTLPNLYNSRFRKIPSNSTLGAYVVNCTAVIVKLCQNIRVLLYSGVRGGGFNTPPPRIDIDIIILY